MRGWNIVYILSAVIAGIISARYISEFWIIVFPLALATGCFGLGFLRRDPSNPERANQLNLAGAVFLFAGLGFLSGMISRAPELPVAKKSYSFEASIEDISYSTGGDRLLADVRKLTSEDGVISNVSGLKALITADEVSKFSRGDIISGVAELSHIELKGNYLNEDYTRYLRNKGILLRGFAEEGKIVKTGSRKSPATWGKDIRDEIEIKIEKLPLKPDVRNFLISILLGDREYLSDELKNKFADSGISHILALSGLHVSIIAMFLLYVFSIFFWRGNAKWKYLICIPAVWLFVLVTGLSPATVRAAMMISIYFGAIILERKYHPFKSLLWTVIIILLVSPASFFDIGFQLSVICVASLILFVKPLTVSEKSDKGPFSKILSLILVSLVATISSWAVCSFYFDRFAFIFLPANMIVVPLLPFYIGIAIVYIIAYSAGISIPLFGFLLDKGYDGLMGLVDWVSSLGGVVTDFSVGSITVMLWLLALAVLALRFHYPKKFPLWTVPVAFSAAIISVPLFLQDKSKNGFIIQTSYPDVNLTVYRGAESEIVSLPRHQISSTEINGKKIIMAGCPVSELDPETAAKIKSADFLILGMGFNDEASDLADVVAEKTKIIIHHSIRKKRENALIEHFQSNGIPFHSIRHSGAFHCFDK